MNAIDITLGLVQFGLVVALGAYAVGTFLNNYK